MTHPGRRRIDRVLAADFLTDIAGQALEDLRAMRAEAEQEEADLSYIRRLIQGRIDILRAELNRRETGGEGSIIDDLPRILAEEMRPGARGLGRHASVEPSRVDEHRRYVEALVADVGISDVTAQSDDALRGALRTLEAEEEQVSSDRRLVQQAMDACAAEMMRRYRDGDADVEALLPSDAG
ncbi:MAG: hypothetical protein QOK42_384 [Frankiaceae bacterium]|jgi:hypothetical protein|nr:hypothetical protein [Frankiaceae bacterium]MDX6225251.1 hypothetical protein [Frankiales bacterium]MDX6273243.1 hypothetical protein [Frankiales bacterium]